MTEREFLNQWQDDFGKAEARRYSLPLAECDSCEWMALKDGDAGHCYMFRDPPGERCGQFKKNQSQHQ
jgi:hypothetical protein